jgi:hypothetical protein
MLPSVSSLAKIDRGELLALAILFGLGLFMVWEGSSFAIGTPRRMGPGFFPVGIGLLLIAFAVALIPEAMRAERRSTAFPLRVFLAVTVSLVLFAVLVGTAGLVPATLVLVVGSSLGDPDFRPLRTAITAIVVAAIGYALFVWAFRLPLDPFWW